MASTTGLFDSPKPARAGRTFAHQSKLPTLPIPPLQETCARYLRALEALQTPEEHEATKAAVRHFLDDPDQGPRAQRLLLDYASDKDSYIEEFWYESYLSHSDPVVLALNPFFVLEDDPTPARGSQLPRAAALITSSLGFIHDLRAELLEPDAVRGIPLDMDQYTRLFGTARIPTSRGNCRMHINSTASHIVVLRRGQFYWFDVLDADNRPVLTEREILRNLQAIVADADRTTPRAAVAANAVGVLSTENRRTWSALRDMLQGDRHNRGCLQVVDDALFIVCLDEDEEVRGRNKDKGKGIGEDLAQLCANFLCGTYELSGGVQVGTCTNRWYDKLQIIVCSDGSAGINFEHTGVDGHTVLRFAADVYTDGLMLLARAINPSAPALFHAQLSPYAKSYKPPKSSSNAGKDANLKSPTSAVSATPPYPIDTVPKKLEWDLTPELRAGIRFAETRLSDLICQNDCQALEFRAFGKVFMTSHGFSPDAFVQMAFQAAYYALYGRTECTYEPAMTKMFKRGRTEAVRTVGKESVDFTKTYFSDAPPAEKIAALKKACERHVVLTKECAKGLGQDRHLYALYCLLQREIAAARTRRADSISGSSPSRASQVSASSPTSSTPGSPVKQTNGLGSEDTNGTVARRTLPEIFTDPGWSLLSTSILSTSNCGNPALRLFGFGPVAADGYGIGYIIKDDGISICASSKHLQTRRFLDTLEGYLRDAQRLIVHLHRAANAPPAPFVDHTGTLRDARTGRPIDGHLRGRPSTGRRITNGDHNYGGGEYAYVDGDYEAGEEEGEGEALEDAITGYSFFDSGSIADLLGRERTLRHKHRRTFVGKVIPMAEY